MNHDEELIARCRKGEAAAQEALYKKYASRMRYVCLRYARTNFEVEDIFQEAFVKVFANLTQYAGSGSLDGWIRRIFVNTAVDYYKKNIRWSEHRSLEINGYEPAELYVVDDKFEEWATQLTETDLLELVNMLPDGYRMVFNLYVIEQFSHAQIAETLKISDGTSKSQLAKARRMLKGLVKERVAKSQVEVLEVEFEKGVSKIDVSA